MVFFNQLLNALTNLKQETDCRTKDFPKDFVLQASFIIGKILLINNEFKSRKNIISTHKLLRCFRPEIFSNMISNCLTQFQAFKMLQHHRHTVRQFAIKFKKPQFLSILGLF